ncbi:hypothetical protein GCM10009661_75190 [Catellatospora chokoriensis]
MRLPTGRAMAAAMAAATAADSAASIDTCHAGESSTMIATSGNVPAPTALPNSLIA